VNNQTIALVGLLACATTFVASPAHADPHGIGEPPPPLTPETIEARRVNMVDKLTVWLPRLVGRYRYEGVVQFFQTLKPGALALKEPLPKTYAGGTCDETCESDIPNLMPAKGKGDCVAIGAGPGVNCVTHVVWNEEWMAMGGAVEGGVSFLGPATILYGYDANDAAIRYLMLNTNGIAESETGVLKGETVGWRYSTFCESATMARCRQVTRIRIPPGDRPPQLMIDIEKEDHGDWLRVSSFTLDMLRESEEQVAAVSGATAGSGLR